MNTFSHRPSCVEYPPKQAENIDHLRRNATKTAFHAFLTL